MPIFGGSIAGGYVDALNAMQRRDSLAADAEQRRSDAELNRARIQMALEERRRAEQERNDALMNDRSAGEAIMRLMQSQQSQLGAPPAPQAPMPGQSSMPAPRPQPAGPQMGAPAVPPYQPLPQNQPTPQPPAEPMGAQAPVPGAASPALRPPPAAPAITFESVSKSLIEQGVKGEQLWRTLQAMAPRMDQEFKNSIAALNLEVRRLQNELAQSKVDDKAPQSRQVRRGRKIETEEFDPTTRTWKVVGSGEMDKPASTTINNPAAVTPVTIQDPDDPNATIIVDGRTGARIGKGPKLTEVGKLEKNRQFKMEGIGKSIQEAEELLTGKGGKALPTGSGVGTIVDAAASLVGVSPSGAAEAQQLKAIGGALVSKMPRMEGPQSDKDLALYREMAGVVADSTIPRDRRIAALAKVKELWGKYENMNPGVFEDQSPAAGGRAPSPGQSPYVEIRVTKDGKKLGKKSDGTIEVIRGNP